MSCTDLIDQVEVLIEKLNKVSTNRNEVSGGITYRCPFCGEFVEISWPDTCPDISTIVHKEDCVMTVAKSVEYEAANIEYGVECDE